MLVASNVQQDQSGLNDILEQGAQGQGHPLHRQDVVTGFEQLSKEQPAFVQVCCDEEDVALCRSFIHRRLLARTDRGFRGITADANVCPSEQFVSAPIADSGSQMMYRRTAD
jgi:hypothetical protein